MRERQHRTACVSKRMTRQSRPGQAASVPGRSRNPLLSTQAQSPHGQSEPSMRRPHESTEKLSGFCSFLPFSYEPCFHTHSMKSRLGPMQKGFLIQGLVLLSVPRAQRPKTRVAVTRRTKRCCFLFTRKFFGFAFGSPLSRYGHLRRCFPKERLIDRFAYPESVQ